VGAGLKPQNRLLGCSESYLGTDIVAVFDKKQKKKIRQNLPFPEKVSA
jgi:hypothetical protein